MPALTGLFFGVFEVLLLAYFIISLFKKSKKVYYSIFILIFSIFIVLCSTIFNPIDIKSIKVISTIFLLVIIYLTYYLIFIGQFSVKGALKYWAIGIFFNFLVVVLQQIFWSVELFNVAELKSSPLPGSDLIRASGLLYNPNSLAAYSIFVALYALYKKDAIFFSVACICLILTFSKTVILLPLMTLVIFLFCYSRLKSVLFILIYIVLFIYSFDALMALFEYRLLNADSLESRLQINSFYFSGHESLIQVFFGHGVFADNAEGGRIHNRFFSAMYQFGLFGLVLVLVFYLYPILLAFKLSLSNSMRVFSFSTAVTAIALANVSTITFFSFDYIYIVLLVALMREEARLGIPSNP